MEDKKVIIVGTRDTGMEALRYFGPKNVYCFVGKGSQGRLLEGIPILSYEQLKEIYFNYEIVVAVKHGSVAAVEAQLQEAGVHRYTFFGDSSFLAASQGAAVSSFFAPVYNDLYGNDTENEEYRKHYSHCIDYVGWQFAIKYLMLLDRSASILEIGCGPGQFANMLFDYGFSEYIGFDFSKTAVSMAKKANPAYADRFVVADMFQTSLMEQQFDLVICFEVLEHLEADLEALSRIRPGTKMLLSVPSTDDPHHVRFFPSSEAVRERYQGVMKIFDIWVVARRINSCLFYVAGEKI